MSVITANLDSEAVYYLEELDFTERDDENNPWLDGYALPPLCGSVLVPDDAYVYGDILVVDENAAIIAEEGMLPALDPIDSIYYQFFIIDENAVIIAEEGMLPAFDPIDPIYYHTFIIDKDAVIIAEEGMLPALDPIDSIYYHTFIIDENAVIIAEEGMLPAFDPIDPVYYHTFVIDENAVIVAEEGMLPAFDFVYLYTYIVDENAIIIAEEGMLPAFDPVYTERDYFQVANASNVITVQYRGNGHTGGAVPASHSVTTPGSITLRPHGSLVRTGHTFGGWRDSMGRVFPAGHTMSWTGITSGTITLDAHWVPAANVTLTFNANGGTPATQQIFRQPGTAIGAMPSSPTRPGHTFLGWFNTSATTGGTQITSSTITPTSNTTYWARWRADNVITITYRGNGHTGGVVPASHSVTTPGSITLRPHGSLVRTGHTFGGWTDSMGRLFPAGHTMSWGGISSGTITLDAHWVPVTNVTLTFNANGGTPATQQIFRQPGTAIGAMPSSPTRAGHTFLGWFNTSATTGGTQITSSTITPTSNTTYWARWRADADNVITIMYRGNGHTGGTVPASHSVTTPGSITLRPHGSLVRTGHIFGGWTDSMGRLFPAGHIMSWGGITSGTITLDAYWVPVTNITLIFNANGGTPTTQQITRPPGTAIGAMPPTPTRAGHIFLGWFNTSAIAGGTQITSNTITPASNTTYWARWRVDNIITINYRGNGHTSGTAPAEQSLTTPGSITLRPQGDLARIGHQFGGWRDQAGNIFAAGSIVTWNVATSGLLILDAYWIRGASVILTFNANGGTPTTQQITRPPGSVMGTMPTAPTRVNHTFAGWFTTQAVTGGTQFTSTSTVPSTNTTYWARWNSTVTFNANGGGFDPTELAETEIWTYDETEIINAAEIFGTTDDILPEPLSVATTTRVVASGAAIGAFPPDPRWAEHTFLHWLPTQTGGNPISPATIVNGHTHFWAGWQANPRITNPATDGQIVLMLPLNVTWQAITGATHRLTLFNMTTGSTPINNQIVTGNSSTIPESLLTAGHQFRVQISATLGGRTFISNRVFFVEQAGSATQIRGPRVIEGFERNGYINVSSATTAVIEHTSGASVRMPIWNFVHISGNDFAIRNDTTGRYFTETNGIFRHEARISRTGTNYNNRQRWRLVAQPDGSYRIRSLSNTSLYITGDINPHSPDLITLAALNPRYHRQSWWIGYIWHYGRNYEDNGVGFWDGTINIQVRPISPETHPAGFNFTQRMDTARNAWGSVLGITFNEVTNRADANIRVYAGCRFEIQEAANWPWVSSRDYGAAYMPLEEDIPSLGMLRGRERAGTIQAGGATRDVYRFFGTGGGAAVIFVFTGTTRHTNLATFTTMHELGHALGYMGHSPNNNDIMRRRAPLFTGNPNETLQPAEIEHLRQIYHTFRNR